MGRGQSWTETVLPEGISHLDWLLEHGTRYTREAIAGKLDRSVNAVEAQMRRHGIEWMPDTVVQGADEEPEEIYGIEVEALLKFIKNRPRSLGDLSTEFDRSEETMRLVIEELLARSYEITQTEGRQLVWSTKVPKIVAPPTILWDKDTWDFRLGVRGDWHDGSKGAQISARNKAMEVMYDSGVRDIIVPGDINAGHKVYRGQELDSVSERPDDQTAITETYCSRYDDLRYHIMGGNHDYSFIKEGGHNALKALCEKRDDFLYYGYDLVTVRLTENVDALVWHPRGGQAYAMSYRSQKMIEQVAFEQLMEVIKKNVTPKVRFLFVGHWHGILMGYAKGPIWIQHSGAFEGQTNLSRQMGVFPELAAVILEGKITKDRNIIRDLTTRCLRFTEIEEDYLNYPVPPKKQPELEPIFEWKVEEDK